MRTNGKDTKPTTNSQRIKKAQNGVYEHFVLFFFSEGIAFH